MFYIRERYESSLKFIKRLICMPSRFLKPHDRGAESDVDEKITERKRERDKLCHTDVGSPEIGSAVITCLVNFNDPRSRHGRFDTQKSGRCNWQCAMFYNQIYEFVAERKIRFSVSMCSNAQILVLKVVIDSYNNYRQSNSRWAKMSTRKKQFLSI